MSGRTGRLAGAVACVAGLLTLLVAPAALAQSDAGLLTVRGIDGTDAKQVKLTFLWTGAPGDLKDLTIRENGRTIPNVKVDSFRKGERRIGTAVVLDLSGSMGDDGALTSAKAAINAIAADLPEGDQIAIIGFKGSASVESAFTSDAGQIKSALEGMAAPRDGRTAMYDAIRKAAVEFESRPNLQPNVLLVTDGSDDASTSTLDEARAAVVNSGAAFFALELNHAKEVDSGAIKSIIDRTGGAAFGGSTDAEIDKAFDSVMTTMRSQFIASYASTVEQGAVDVSVAVGTIDEDASYVAGGRVQGAQAELVKPVKQAFGPDWMHGSTGSILAVLLVGLGVGLGVFAFVSLASNDDTGLDSRLSPYSEGMAEEEGDSSLAQTAFLQRAVDLTEEFAQRQGFLQKVEHMLERADLPLRAAEAIFFYGAGVLIVAVGAMFLMGLVAGLIITIVIALVPPAVVNFMASRRQKKFVSLLPDTLSLLSGSLRAGYSLMQGIEAVSQEVEEPMGKELRRVISEARLGREIEDAMDSVAERMDSPDFAWAVMAIQIQREVGGNLSELLLTVSETMVQRERLRRDVASLTAEGRISAIILGLLPVGLGAFMWMSNPVYMAPLKDTGLGQAMLGLSVVSMIVGFLWMKKTITIEI